MNINSISSIGFIGGGNMARSIIGGLLEVGYERNSIIASDPVEQARQHLNERFNITATDSNRHVVDRSEVVVLAVKPQVMSDALSSIRDELQHKRPLLISIAAGIRLAQLDEQSGGNLAIVRVMPNTPALIRQGVSALCANSRTGEDQRARAGAILDAVGETEWFDDESLLDAVTAVSGSGPAYFFYIIEALQEAAEKLGLPAQTARTLAVKTAVGAAQLADFSDDTPAQLRKQVTSPGGVTQEALGVLDSSGVKDAFVRAIAAGERRSAELSSP